MALTADTPTNSFQGNVSSFTFSHTVAAGAKKVLIVTVDGTAANGVSVTALTYNNIPLLKLRRDVGLTDQTFCECWYLVNPPVGSNTVSVTLSGAVGQRVAGHAWSFSDADIRTPIGASGFTASSAVASPSSSLTTTRANSIIVCTFQARTDGNSVTGFGIVANNTYNQTGNMCISGGRSTNLAAGSNTVTLTGTGSFNSQAQSMQLIEVLENTGPQKNKVFFCR